MSKGGLILLAVLATGLFIVSGWALPPSPWRLGLVFAGVIYGYIIGRTA